MMYSYDGSVNGILKASFLYAHTGIFPVFEEEIQNSLFISPKKHVKEIDWVEIFKLDPRFKMKKDEIQNNSGIIGLILYNLRHGSLDKYHLLVEGIKELIEIPGYIWLTGTTDLAKKLLLRKNDVGREIHKMLGYIRFVPLGDKFLVGTAPLEHETADLILIRFRQRYPGYCLGLIVGEDAIILQKNDVIIVEDGKTYLNQINNDNFKEIWKEYYKSQYIKERKNIRYVQRSIPKKYWHWIEEGSIIAEEE